MSNNYQQQDNATRNKRPEVRQVLHRSYLSDRPNTSLTRAASNTISSSSTTTEYYKNNFPQKLYRMLEYADTSPHDVQTIISWQPHGRSFMVKDKKRLQTEVLPLFFTTVHYDSFRRNLNHWGFHLINGVKNPDCGSYYHHLFLRTRLDLANKIKRVKDKSFTPPVLNNAPSNTSSSSSARIPFYEPNFYEMEWLPQTQIQIPQVYPTSSTISNSRQSTNTSAATFAQSTTTDSVKPSSICWDPRSSNHLSSDSSRSFMAPSSIRSTSCTSSSPSSDDMKMESSEEKASSTEAASSDNSSSDNQAPPSRMSTSCTSSSPSSDDMIIEKSRDKTKKVASLLMHDSIGDDIWDEEHWQSFLMQQYHLLPSDLSELASVFDD